MIFTLCSVAGGTSESFSCQAELIIPHNAAADFFFFVSVVFVVSVLAEFIISQYVQVQRLLCGRGPSWGFTIGIDSSLFSVNQSRAQCHRSSYCFSLSRTANTKCQFFFFPNVRLKYGCVLVPLSGSRLNESGEDQTVYHDVNCVENLSSCFLSSNTSDTETVCLDTMTE